MKKIFAMFLASIILITTTIIPALADENIKVLLDGKEISFDVPPQIINDRTMVPMRAIFEALGYNVEWDGNDQSITAINPQTNKYVYMILDNLFIVICPYDEIKRGNITDGYVLNNMRLLDQAPTIVGNRTLVPIRAVVEASGLNVVWNATEKR